MKIGPLVLVTAYSLSVDVVLGRNCFNQIQLIILCFGKIPNSSC